MKKIILSIAVVIAAYGANAQGFYGELSVGYGMGNPSEVLGQTYVSGLGTYSSENNYGTIGQGLNITLTPGFMITEHFGIDLGISYFMGAKKIMDDQTNSTNANEFYKSTAQSNQLRLIPGLIVSTGVTNKVSGYAKVGLVAPVMGVTKGEVNNGYMVGPNAVTIVAKREVKGALSVGFKAALGINYNLSETISLFGEIQSISLFIKQKSSKFTEFSVNNVDIKDNAPMMEAAGYSLTTDYLDKIDNNSGNNKALAGKTTFNQVGINLGLRFNF